jgi:hypothetical protein
MTYYLIGLGPTVDVVSVVECFYRFVGMDGW